MEILKLKINQLTPYEKNSKQHPEKQINQICESIKRFGMNDPIGIWGQNNIVVEGHGRLLALKKLGIEEVDCIRLDHLTDIERKEYTLIHNKTTMNSDFDFDILEEELKDIDLFDDNIDMADFDFDLSFLDEKKVVELSCAIGDEFIDGKPYSEIVEIARNYIESLGGFEEFAKWGIIK